MKRASHSPHDDGVSRRMPSIQSDMHAWMKYTNMSTVIFIGSSHRSSGDSSSSDSDSSTSSSSNSDSDKAKKNKKRSEKSKKTENYEDVAKAANASDEEDMTLDNLAEKYKKKTNFVHLFDCFVVWR